MRLKWTVFASGGPLDNPWDAEKEVEADTYQEAITNAGFDPGSIDGVIRSEILEDYQQ